MPVWPAGFKRQGTGLSPPDDRGGPEEVEASGAQLGVTSQPWGRHSYTKRPPLGVSRDPVILRRSGPTLSVQGLAFLGLLWKNCSPPVRG